MILTVIYCYEYEIKYTEIKCLEIKSKIIVDVCNDMKMKWFNVKKMLCEWYKYI